MDEHLNDEKIEEDEPVNIDKNGQHPVLCCVWYLVWAAIYVFVAVPICMTSCVFYLILSPISTLLPTLAPLTMLLQAGVETQEKMINLLYNSGPEIDNAMCAQLGENVKTRMNDFIQKCQEVGNNTNTGMNNFIQKCQEFGNNTNTGMKNFFQKCKEFGINLVLRFHR